MRDVGKAISLTDGIEDWIRENRIEEEMEKRGYKRGGLVPHGYIGTVSRKEGIFGCGWIPFYGQKEVIIRRFYFNTEELVFEEKPIIKKC